MNRLVLFALLLAGLVSTRLCHMRILWAEEGLPMAAAAQMEAGKTLYRDVWFDKPPLVAAGYLLWGVREGWPLRMAGALYALLCCVLIYDFARDLWGEGEARWAAALLAFFLTFDIPSAVVPLAADSLMLAPHIAAVHLAWRGQAAWSGVMAGLAFLINAKGVFVAAACALWSFAALPALVAGFAAPCAAAAAVLAAQGALGPYYEQVWKWGRVYAGGTFVSNPAANALRRTASWLGFHAALAIPSVWGWFRISGDRRERWRWAGWAVLSLAAAAAGWRFFPRYFFQLLPVATLLGARGIVWMGRKRVLAAACLLLPLIRFGPRYVVLARDLWTGREHEWVDVAMDRDSREAARLTSALARRGDTLLVWGFRPELFIYTRLPAACRFLDSQPLTGVPADRHLFDSEPLTPSLAATNRQELVKTQPSLILDGLGLLNPRLAITAYPDLAGWLAGYERVAQSRSTIIYRRRR